MPRPGDVGYVSLLDRHDADAAALAASVNCNSSDEGDRDALVMMALTWKSKIRRDPRAVRSDEFKRWMKVAKMEILEWNNRYAEVDYVLLSPRRRRD